MALESPFEYKHWLFVFIRKLTELGDEGILGEICHEFKMRGSSTILGYHCANLLTEILQIMSSNRKLQNIVEKYSQKETKQLF